MNQEKQPEALRLADWCDANSSGAYRTSSEAAAELRRLHAENIAQRSELVAEAARTAEEKLRADQMTEQHRMQCDISKSAVATLVGLGYTDRGGEQWAPPIGKAPDFNLLDAANAQISELQFQLSAIGAGGVEKLRKREQECGNCFEGKSDLDHTCRKCGGSGAAPAQEHATQLAGQGQEPAAWLASYQDREGNEASYVTTHYQLALENDARGQPVALYRGASAAAHKDEQA